MIACMNRMKSVDYSTSITLNINNFSYKYTKLFIKHLKENVETFKHF